MDRLIKPTHSLTEHAVLARRKRRKIRRLRLELLAQYRRRGEIIAHYDLDDLPSEDVAELITCRELHRRWDDFRVAERWQHRHGGATPDNVRDALRLIDLWAIPPTVN